MTRTTPSATTHVAELRNQIWPRSTTLFLVLVGTVLSIASFVVVLNVPELPWPADADQHLRDAYAAYRETGTLPLTSGAMGGGGSSLNPISQTAGVGAVLVACLLGPLFGFPSPHVVLGIVQAVVVAIPLVWLPLCVGRIFKRARAGYALVLLPPIIWLLNSGTVLVGTEYGLSEEAGTLRVGTLYGLPASLLFLALSLLILLRTMRLSRIRLTLASGAIGILAGVISLFDWYSAIAVVIAVPIAWWTRAPRRHRLLEALASGAIALVLMVGAHAAVTGVVHLSHSDESETYPVASAALWRDMYGGLAYPESVGGALSPVGVRASEDWIRDQVDAVSPGAVEGTAQYSQALRDLYFAAIAEHPADAVATYWHKALYVIKHFGAMISFIAIGFVLALTRRAPQRRALLAAFAIAFPAVLIGFAVAIHATPDVFSYAQLSASLGLLTAVALGAIVWSITSMPSHVRSLERSRLSGRRRNGETVRSAQPIGSSISVIVPTRNGEGVLEETLHDLGSRLDEDDEIIVVENGSTDGTTALVTGIRDRWPFASHLSIIHSEPGLGEALRTGVLHSRGAKLLLTADDLPFGFTDLDAFLDLDKSTAVAIGSKAHPRSRVTRSRLRTIQSRIFRFLRAALLQSRVGDSQGTLWVDGPWGREFALLSRESGLMWTTELVLAAEQQMIEVREVPVALSNRHETGASRFRVSDAWQSFVGFTRLAVYKDDYCNEDWVPSTRPDRDPEDIAG